VRRKKSATQTTYLQELIRFLALWTSIVLDLGWQGEKRTSRDKQRELQKKTSG
jgi:hypothetical protein